MKTVELAQATASLEEYASQLTEEPVILTDHGTPVAALVSLANADRETVTLSTSPEFLAIIARSRARQEAEGGISTEEMRRRLQIPKSP